MGSSIEGKVATVMALIFVISISSETLFITVDGISTRAPKNITVYDNLDDENRLTETIRFDMIEPSINKYNRLIQQIRDAAKGDRVFEGIPMLGPPAAADKDSNLLIEMKTMRGEVELTVTVAIHKQNLYVVGYMEGNQRGFIFPDAPYNADNTLFPKVADKRKIDYYGDYDSLEDYSGIKRYDQHLSLARLHFLMIGCYGVDVHRTGFLKSQAKFLLLVITMFSDAARFKYIQRKYTTGGLDLDYKVPSLENSWRKLSSSIKNAEKRKLYPPLDLKDIDNNIYRVTYVEDVKNDMGILCYVE